MFYIEYYCLSKSCRRERLNSFVCVRTRGDESEAMPGWRLRATRRGLEEAQTRAVLATVLTVLLPLAVIVVSGALARHRHWLLMQSMRV